MSYEEAKEIKRKRAFNWPSEQGEDDQKDLEGEDNEEGPDSEVKQLRSNLLQANMKLSKNQC